MVLNSFDVVYYTSVFILPGFIIKGIINITNPSTKTTDNIYFISCLMYSIISCAVWSWFYVLVNPLKNSKEVLYWVVCILVTIIGALIIGCKSLCNR